MTLDVYADLFESDLDEIVAWSVRADLPTTYERRAGRHIERSLAHGNTWIVELPPSLKRVGFGEVKELLGQVRSAYRAVLIPLRVPWKFVYYQ